MSRLSVRQKRLEERLILPLNNPGKGPANRFFPYRTDCEESWKMEIRFSELGTLWSWRNFAGCLKRLWVGGSGGFCRFSIWGQTLGAYIWQKRTRAYDLRA